MSPVVAEPSRTPAGLLKSAGGRLLSLPISYVGTILLVVCAGLTRPMLLQPFLLMLILRQPRRSASRSSDNPFASGCFH